MSNSKFKSPYRIIAGNPKEEPILNWKKTVKQLIGYFAIIFAVITGGYYLFKPGCEEDMAIRDKLRNTCSVGFYPNSGKFVIDLKDNDLNIKSLASFDKRKEAELYMKTMEECNYK